MVLSVSIKPHKSSDTYVTDYTVELEKTKVLTVVTHSSAAKASDWFKQVLSSPRSNTSSPLNGFPADSIFVGVVADENPAYSSLRNKVKALDRPFDMLSFCIGGDCLILELNISGVLSKPVKEFLNHPRVVLFGTQMKELTKRLELTGVRNAVDINKLAVTTIDRPELDLGRYDLDKLAETVLGRDTYVLRPQQVRFSAEPPEVNRFSLEKILYTTVDSFLCLKVGETLHKIRDKKVDVPRVKIPDPPETKRTGKTREKSPKPGRSDAEEIIRTQI